jgi:hypothetical protein
MPDLRKYWQEIRAIERSLPGDVWLMSLENRARGQVAGSLAEVAAAIAAKLLHAKSHRLATEKETEAHQTRQKETHRQGIQQKLREDGIAIIPVRSRPRSE